MNWRAQRDAGFGEYFHGRLTELAVYRPSTGQWFVRNRFVVQFGDVGDVPVCAHRWKPVI